MKGLARGRRIRLGVRTTLLALALALGGCGDGPEFVSFVAIGDMGTSGPGQQRVAAAIAERAGGEPIQFMVTLGDNFYPAGVLSTGDPLWTSAFEDVYDDPSLRVPVRPTLGNHDHLGFPLVQVGYSEESDRWAMPATFYTYSHYLEDGTEVAFFAIDTEQVRAGLDGTRDPDTMARRIANVRRTLNWRGEPLAENLVRYIADRVHENDEFTVSRILRLARTTGSDVDESLILGAISASVDEDYEAQLEWLNRQLAGSSARWKIVYGHHPLYGHHPTRGHLTTMIDRVEPILVRHGVDLYIAGHDHFTDIMKPVRGVHYVTSGGGAGDDHPYPIERTDESYYVQSGGGFTLFRVTHEEIEVEVVDLDGVTRYTLIHAK